VLRAQDLCGEREWIGGRSPTAANRAANALPARSPRIAGRKF